MPNVDIYSLRNDSGEWVAFIGLSQNYIEMLFVCPEEMGKGLGSLMVEFAVKERRIRKVDVNEQNHRALGFYRKHGFSIVGRDGSDAYGKPYPHITS